MEICEKGEIFVEKDDDFVFDHTKIILRGADGEFFYAKSDQRIFRSPKIDINGLDTIRIPADRVWPLADPEFTRAPDPLPSTCYLKRPSLLYYENTPDKPDYDRHILTEVGACEILRVHPHPNIAQYLGCIVKDGRIRGLGFAKYSITLSQMLKDGTPFNRSRCLRGIEAGVSHMHSLGLIHNDLNPSNIMMDGDDPVIIDFDSCKQEGDELGSKAGTYGWTLNGADYARPENDLYSLSKIRADVMKDNIEC
ncbi:kinase-like domain-containing protein [Podospora didyma]|uniref:Kinase-like domain-containing protein n=1 Tax=Podospora didyma TaxID=330526 RepID=A0AAE0KJ70_9PEZI|nr:kinase-like domain-containing protein [Podospora didyma]